MKGKWFCLIKAFAILIQSDDTVKVLKFLTLYSILVMRFFLKMPSGMATSVDPDQMAPLGAI